MTKKDKLTPNMFATIYPVIVDPASPIEEQKTALDKLIVSKPSGSIVITITPELAAYILTLNFRRNRRPKPIKIKDYNDAMKAGKWEVNGETIKFADDGYMHDGQNRTMACIRAGVPFTTHVVFGIAASSFSTIDTGKPKDGDDMLTNAGYTNTKNRAAALRWLMILQSANIQNRAASFTTQQILDRQKKLDDDGEDTAFNAALNEAINLNKKAKVFVVSSMTPFIYLYTKYDHQVVASILWDADRDVGNMRKLRTTLTKISSSSTYRSVEDTVRNALIILTFNAYCNHKRLSQTGLNWSSVDPYPKLPW